MPEALSSTCSLNKCALNVMILESALVGISLQGLMDKDIWLKGKIISIGIID